MIEKDIIKENKDLKRKLRVMEESLKQFSTIKNSYDNLIKNMEEKDKKLLEMNEKLEFLVKERTKELEEKNHQLNELAITDALTGLKNRRNFNKIFEQEYSRAKRQKYQFNLMIIDIDYFKNFNDNYGHNIGDLVLRKIGEILKKSSKRSNDFAFRYGGEEFTYLSSYNRYEDFFNLAENIREEIYYSEIEYLDKLTVSIGGIVSLSDTISKNELFDIADKNLYTSKENGRNQTYITFLE